MLSVKLDFLNILFIISFLLILQIFYKIRQKEKFQFKFQKKLELNDLILILIFWLSVFSRIYSIKDLIVPPAFDPILIGTISRLIVDNQGIPDSWQPYMPTKLSYPPGFPSIIAWYNIISNVPIPTIILFFTNFIQALLPVAVYAFALAVFKNKSQSIAAAIIALIAVYPIFTSGDNAIVLTFFLIIVSLTMIYSKNNFKRDYASLIALFVLSVAGFLVYSTFAFYLLLIILPFFIYETYKNGLIKPTKKYLILSIFLILLPFLFTLSYYSQFYTKQINKSDYILAEWNRNAEEQIPNYNNSMNVAYSILLEPFLYILDGKINTPFLQLNSLAIYDIFFVFIFLASIYIIFKNKSRAGLIFVLTYVIFVLFSNALSYVQLYVFPVLDYMPILYYVRPTRISHFIFLPLSLIFSYFFIELRKWKIHKINFAVFILIILAAFGLYNIIETLTLNSNSLVSTDQKNAFDWIDTNIPKNSTILNVIIGFDPGGFKGDAGQWIPAITGRMIIYPSISLFEDVSLNEIKEKLELMKLIDNNQIETSEFKSVLKKYNITYIFLTDRYVFFDREHKISNYEFNRVNPKEFLNISDYRLVFQFNQTFIFQVLT